MIIEEYFHVKVCPLKVDIQNIIDNVRDQFSCVFCLKLVDNPKNCINCEVIFCQKCLEDYLTYNDKCPRCEEKPFLTKKSIMLMRILNSSKIQCGNCPQVFQYDQLDVHSLSCIKANKIYICKKCNAQLPIQNENELVNHLDQCLESCQYCKKDVPLSLLKSHENSCRWVIRFILRCCLEYFDNINKQNYANLAMCAREILNELEK
jgi:hypothetical protein